MHSRQFVMVKEQDFSLFRCHTPPLCSAGVLDFGACWSKHFFFGCFRTKVRLCRETKDGVTRS